MSAISRVPPDSGRLPSGRTDYTRSLKDSHSKYYAKLGISERLPVLASGNVAPSPSSSAATTPLLGRVSSGSKPIGILRYGCFVVRVLMTLIAVLGVVANVILLLPILLVITLLKSLYYLVKGDIKNSGAVWGRACNGLKLFVGNSAVQSYNSAKKILNPEIEASEWVPELLALLIDTTGEARNSLSVANDVGAISSIVLDFTLGPLRILQGVLSVILSAFSLIKMQTELNKLEQKLDKSAVDEIRIEELKLQKKSQLFNLFLGFLWIAKGAIQIGIGLTAHVSFPVMLALAIITFILFDIGFITQSGFLIAQTILTKKRYIRPIQEFIEAKRTSSDSSIPTRTHQIMEKVFSQQLMGKINNRYKIQGAAPRAIRNAVVEPPEEQDTLLDEMASELTCKNLYHKYFNIGLIAIGQIGITLAGTPWDVSDVIYKTDSVARHALLSTPGSAIATSTQDACWISYNTVCKSSDDGGFVDVMTGTGHVKADREDVQSIAKTYAIGMLILFLGLVISTDISGFGQVGGLRPILHIA